MAAEAPTLADLFLASAARHGQRECLSWGEDGRASYGEVAAAVAAQGEAIRDGGLGGHRVGLMAANRPELVVLWLACIEAGVTPVFLNPRLTDAELGGIVDDLEIGLVVGDRELAGGAACAVLGERPAAAAVPLPAPSPGAARFEPAAGIVLTSGSTGRPKYVPVPHAAYALKAMLNSLVLGWTAADRAFCVMPLSHVGAQCETLAPALARGAAVRLEPSFTASGLWDQLEAHAITHLHATGSLLAMALARGSPSRSGPPRRVVASLRGDVASALRESLPGAALFSLYGLTECPLGTLSNPGEEARPGWVGYPYLGGSVRIRDEEIQLRNPACTRGYIGLPPGEGFTEDGWLRTGDLGADVDGGLRLTGRRKEMIRRGGENIAPAEVEEAALGHPGVVEAAAVSFPDSVRDEEVWLLVEARDADAAPAPRELREFLARRLARFKLPRYVDVLAELPTTGSNKVDKPALLRARKRPGWDAEARD